MVNENLINTLKLGFSSSIQKIKIPSLGNPKREYSFREPNVKEVNTISKILLSNSDSQSTVYASTLVFLKYLCMDDDFDPYKMNELDRLKILTYVLSGIFFSKNLTIRCPREGCNTSFPFSIKYGEMIHDMDSIASSEFKFSNKTKVGNIEITAGFPKTSRYLEFLEMVDDIKNIPVDYDSFSNSFVEIDSTKNDGAKTSSSVDSSDSAFIEKIKRRREILKEKLNKSVNDGNSIAGNIDIKLIGKTKSKSSSNRKDGLDMDISYLYIRKILIDNIPNSKDEFCLEFDGVNYDDAVKMIDVIPMKLMIKSDGINFMKFIKTELEKSLNSCSPAIFCPTCGHNISRNIGIQNFFIHG